MRTCKEWMGSHRPNHEHVHTESSLIIQQAIKKEIRNAPNRTVLDRRYTIMSTNLRLMLGREELSAPSYSRLKILLRVEYKNRWCALRKES